jgi:hypothetical protein
MGGLEDDEHPRERNIAMKIARGKSERAILKLLL